MGLFSRFKKKKKGQDVKNNINQVKSEIKTGEQAQVEKLTQVQNVSYVALAGVQELNLNFEQELTKKGKFEVLLFNSVLVLEAYKLKYPEPFSFFKFKKQYVEIIKEYGPTYKVKNSDDVLIAFINHRFDFYTEELSKIFENDMYTPGEVFSAFYVTPLEIILETHYDLSQLLMFKVALTQLITFLHKNVETIT